MISILEGASWVAAEPAGFRFGPLPLMGLLDWPAAGVVPGEVSRQQGTIGDGRYVMSVEVTFAEPVDLADPGETYARLLDLITEAKVAITAERRLGLPYVERVTVSGWSPSALALPGRDPDDGVTWIGNYVLNLEVRFREQE